MPYKIDLLAKAEKQLLRLPEQVQKRLLKSLWALADQPRPPGVKKLVGTAYYRIRVGDYRIIYEIHDNRLLILVLAIVHRSEAYR